MPTALDRALHSKVLDSAARCSSLQVKADILQNLLLGNPLDTIFANKRNISNYFYRWVGFAGMVTAVAAWSIWGTDVFPTEADPTGS